MAGKVLKGNSIANTLIGGSDNDTITGGLGADTLIGGLGDDVYNVTQSNQVVLEAWGSGHDTIFSSVDYSLTANSFVEMLALTGTGNLNLTGNNANNTLVGNAGNNVLDSGGGGGVDTMIGGAGNDTYYVHSWKDQIVEKAGEGIDTVVTADGYNVLPNNVENLTLIGTSSVNGYGNSLANVITGNSGNNRLYGYNGNDTFVGSAGNDSIDGGSGNDTVVYSGKAANYSLAVTAGASTFNELAITVTDKVGSGGADQLGNVETIKFSDGFVNAITGTSGSDLLKANTTPGIVFGGAGNDTMIGSAGNDFFYGERGNDSVDGGDGLDTVVYYGNKANYVVSGTGGIVTVQDMVGNEGTDTLQHVERLQFADQLYDLPGTSTPVVVAPGTPAVVAPATPVLSTAGATGNEDAAIALKVLASLPALTASQSLGVVVSGVPLGAKLSAGISDGKGNWTLTGAQLAGLTITPPANSDASMNLSVKATVADSITGLATSATSSLAVHVNAVADAPTISALAASGTAGTAIALHVNAALTDTDGSESLQIVIGGVPTGATLSAGVSDGHGNWTLTQAQLAGLTLTTPATLSGPLALTATATSTEAANGSHASTSAALSVTVGAVPVVTVPGVVINGGKGNDVIHGGLGADTMSGGAGDDTYFVNNAKDVVNEGWNQGNDTVNASVSYVLTPNSYVETLALTGSGNLNLTGNSAYNTLIGNAGNNVLDSGGGVDTMIGGAGDDTYYVHSWKDMITEKAGEGIDTVVTSDGYNNLPDNVENLTLTGNGDVNGYGNAMDNVITGNAGNNKLFGYNGNDTFIASAGNDTIDGGGGTDTIVYAGNMADYQITAAGSGFTVEDLAHGQGTDSITGIESLKFADQTFTLPVAVSSSGASSGGGSSRVADTLIVRPTVLQASHANDVVGVHIENAGDVAQASRVITFGQVFAKGDVPATAHLVAIVDGKEIPLQLDIKTTNDDGSVRNAVLSLKLPDMPAHGGLDVMLAKSTAPAAAASAVIVGDILHSGYNLSLDVNIHNADGSITAHTVSAADALAKALASGTAESWMNGALATEVRVDAKITDTLTAQFDIRATADGQVHTDVVMAYDSAFTLGMTNITYDFAIKSGGTTVFSQAGLEQNHHSDIHHEVWSGAAPTTQVDPDIDYLVHTGAIPEFDTSIQISSNGVASDYAALQASDTSITGAALNVTYMPQTGQTEGTNVGMLTNWQVKYLLSGDARAAEVMYANADAAGNIPWAFRDAATGNPVSIDDHPGLRISDRAQSGPDALLSPYDTSMTGWTPDSAHAPSPYYLPYLLTGSHYYLDELQFQTAFELATANPGYRGGSDGIITNDQGAQQVRGVAWSLRDFADAAYITPDGDPMKAYYIDKLNNNLDYMVKHYVLGGELDGAGQLEGYMPGDNRIQQQTAGWQQDFLVMTLGELADQGFGQAKEILGWMDNYESGRFLVGDQGLDPALAATYEMYMADPTTGALFTSWTQAYSATFGDYSSLHSYDYGYTGSAGAYMASAKGALATMITETGSANAIEAYGVVVGLTQNGTMIDNYSTMPKWAITPQLADGNYLQNSQMTVASGTGNATVTGGNQDQLLEGNAGNDIVTGGSSIDLLFGNAGNDTLSGGGGNDFLFGGAGDDRLIGGIGNDYMKGNLGADTFVIAENASGHDVIADFAVGIDHLEIKQNLNGNGVMTAADLLATATVDSAGDTVLHLSTHDDIVLLGVAAHHLTASSLILTA